MSTQEALYHGLPALFLPLMTDQFSNAARAERVGYGAQLKWSELSAETLL